MNNHTYSILGDRLNQAAYIAISLMFALVWPAQGALAKANDKALSNAAFLKSNGTRTPASMHDDDVDGTWDLELKVAGAQVTGTLTIKASGSTLSGTMSTEHTGAGTLTKGTLKDGHLEFTAEFGSHDSIGFSGIVKNGKLEGEFTSEGRVGKWIATKAAKAAVRQNAVLTLSNSADLAGEWAAALKGNGTTAPFRMKLTGSGTDLTGTFTSDHMGDGSIEKVTIAGDIIKLTLNLKTSSILLTGRLKDGKLDGDFLSGPMKGFWWAQRK